jgi:16S rRNA (adenine1518-N6/adenine1519-N6)-dimethyltransferase
MNHPKQILNRYAIQPKKSLGQTFLVEQTILRRICDLASLTETDEVLEIGPGLGSLTSILADTAGRVTAVELDDRLIPILGEELACYDNVRLIHDDVLNVNPSELIGDSYKVVANLPYYITGAILRHLLEFQYKPETMILTVQKEVADRLTAKPGDMSILSVSVQLHGEISNEFIIRAGSFWPKPDVDSAVVRFIAHPHPLITHSEQKSFMRLVKIGYSSKRKQLQKNLRAILADRDIIQEVFSAADIDGTRRAQTLSIAEWLSLYRCLLPHLSR